jgi:hypothetical protein
MIWITIDKEKSTYTEWGGTKILLPLMAIYVANVMRSFKHEALPLVWATWPIYWNTSTRDSLAKFSHMFSTSYLEQIFLAH